MRFPLLFALTVAAMLLCAAGELRAQGTETAEIALPEYGTRARTVLPILVFDRTRVMAETNMAQALEAEIGVRRAKILAENDQIYAELEAEEKEIAEQRAKLSDEAFRARASEFDTKVTEARAQQDQKAAEVQKLYEEGVLKIETAMNEALAHIAREVGAVAVFERQQVYLMSGAIDVSEQVVERLDGMAVSKTPAETPASSE